MSFNFDETGSDSSLKPMQLQEKVAKAQEHHQKAINEDRHRVQDDEDDVDDDVDVDVDDDDDDDEGDDEDDGEGKGEQTQRRTIRARAAERLKWAEGLGVNSFDDNPRQGFSRWCCDSAGCENPICSTFREFLAAAVKAQEAKVQEAKVQEAKAQEAKARARTEGTSDKSNSTDINAKAMGNVARETMKSTPKEKKDAPASQDMDELERMASRIADLERENKNLKQTTADQDVTIADQDVTIKKGRVEKEADAIFTAHDNVKTALLSVSLSGNKTRTTKVSVQSRQDRQEAAAKSQPTNDGRTNQSEDPSPTNKDAVLTKERALMPTPTLSDKDTGKLLQFSRLLQNILRNAQVSEEDYQSNRFRRDIAASVLFILNAPVEKKILASDYKQLFKPSHNAQETLAHHPILLAVFERLSTILDCDFQMTHEQYMPKSGDRSQRFIDLVLGDIEEVLQAAISSILSVPLEIKPFSRESTGIETLLENGANQIRGHLAQIIYHSHFNWFGVGKDGSVTGVVMTLVSIEVIKLSLSGVGTKDVKLKLETSGIHPLFDETTTRSLLRVAGAANSNAREDEENEEVDRFIGKFQYASFHQLQSGMKWLASIIKRLRSGKQDKVISCLRPTESHLDLPSVHIRDSSDSNDQTGDETGSSNNLKEVFLEYLGSGGFSDVFLMTGSQIEQGSILKMPKSTAVSGSLDVELKTLRSLNNESIPKSPKFVDVMVRARCERVTVRCLQIQSDAGCRSNDVKVKEHVKKLVPRIITQVISALMHAHSKGFVHLDVRPSNIIVSQQFRKVQLIDWGCSITKSGYLKHYRGCPMYSHRYLLEKSRHSPRRQQVQINEAFDFVPLAYTAAALLNDTERPWGEIHSTIVPTKVLDARAKSAKDILQGTTDTRFVNQMVYFMNLEESNPDRKPSLSKMNHLRGSPVAVSRSSTLIPVKFRITEPSSRHGRKASVRSLKGQVCEVKSRTCNISGRSIETYMVQFNEQDGVKSFEIEVNETQLLPVLSIENHQEKLQKKLDEQKTKAEEEEISGENFRSTKDSHSGPAGPAVARRDKISGRAFVGTSGVNKTKQNRNKQKRKLPFTKNDRSTRPKTE